MTSNQDDRARSCGLPAARPRLALAAFACLLAAFSSVAAEDLAPRVVQVVQPESGEQDPELQEILTRFLSIELERAGLVPVPLREARPIAVMAREQKARFVLLATYARRGQQVDLELRWFESDSSRVAAAERRSGPINLELDTVVASAAQALLERTGARRERAEVAEQPAAPERPAAVERPMALAPAISAAAAAPPQRFRPFESTIAFSAVLTTGYASDYFKYGFMPCLFAGYRLPIARAALALGLSAGFSRFLTEDEIEDTGIEAVPIGAEARYEIGGRDTLLVYLRASVGPALLRFQPAGGGWLAKVVPSATAGIGVGVPLGELFGILVEASYSIYLEEATPLMGFTPAVGSYVRWGG